MYPLHVFPYVGLLLESTVHYNVAQFWKYFACFYQMSTSKVMMTVNNCQEHDCSTESLRLHSYAGCPKRMYLFFEA